MTIKEKVEAVERVFADLNADIAKFQQESGLACLKGCGECCKKPDIEATVLEFLPLAYHLFLTHRDSAIIDILELSKDESMCTLFLNTSPLLKTGMCSMYNYRGLICRLFGFSAKGDKEGRPVLVTCKIIKSQMAEQYQNTVTSISQGAYVPVMNQYYMRLLAIDMQLGNRFYPINEAIKIAIEKVSLSCAYQEEEVVV